MKRPEASNPLELELQVADESADVGVDIETGSSGRATRAFNNWVISLAPAQGLISFPWT